MIVFGGYPANGIYGYRNTADNIIQQRKTFGRKAFFAISLKDMAECYVRTAKGFSKLSVCD
jgi:hypothetical protein